MDEDKKKLVMIIIAVVCIVLAVGITFFTTGGGGGGGGSSNAAIPMLCDSCGVTYEIDRDEFREEMRKLGPQMMMMRGPVVLQCKECGEQAAYRAMKCPECDEVFVLGDAGDEQYPDKCPACGHSDIETRTNNR